MKDAAATELPSAMTNDRCDCGNTADDAHHCNLCHQNITGDVHALLDHLRVLHPAFYEDPERWPDGGLVITEEPASIQDLLDAGVQVFMAKGIGPDSWLHEARFSAFRDAYYYAAGQTRAIEALSRITAEEAYFLYVALKRGHDRSAGGG